MLFRERAVDSNPIVTPVVPSPSTSTATETAKPGTFLERQVGEVVAEAAAALLAALDEFQSGGLTPRTKMRGGDAIVALYKLRAFMVPHWNFDDIAHREGTTALRAACSDELTSRTIDVLIDEVLDILRKVVRDNLN
jgi:hypothetical protein